MAGGSRFRARLRQRLLHHDPAAGSGARAPGVRGRAGQSRAPGAVPRRASPTGCLQYATGGRGDRRPVGDCAELGERIPLGHRAGPACRARRGRGSSPCRGRSGGPPLGRSIESRLRHTPCGCSPDATATGPPHRAPRPCIRPQHGRRARRRPSCRTLAGRSDAAPRGRVDHGQCRRPRHGDDRAPRRGHPPLCGGAGEGGAAELGLGAALHPPGLVLGPARPDS